MPRLSKIGAAAAGAFGINSPSLVAVTYLVVAGGGGGGWRGGGGAGGYQTSTTNLNTTISYTVVVGAGGAASVANDGAQGVNGSNSQFSTLTASIGGGGGGGSNSVGLNGGSGGGGGINNNQSTTYAGGTGTSGQGTSGGNSYQPTGASTSNGGGGGGAAIAGSAAANASTGGAGGTGLASSISGTSTYYAGGGGGGATSTSGTAGTGGGGTGSNSSTAGTPGTANLGGGGGGGGLGQNAGTGGSGVVIISYPAPQKFGGGIVTTSGSNVIHTFNTSGTLTPLSSLTASYLIVAGGGGGGYDVGGGGGGGGLLTGSGLTIDTNSNYLVTVGAGGSGATSAVNGVNGSNSVFSMVTTTAIGGGGGASASNTAGSSGGSGGGGTRISGAGGSATSGQGYAGGAGSSTNGANISAAGGGGGSAAVGANATGGVGGNGGNGVTSSISGTSTYYAGGGGGRCDGTGTQGTGGLGGGGSAGSTGTSATSNQGGGGGGGSTGGGGNGGSGVVIISYAGSTQQMAGGTVTISGGNVIHTFTSSGYLTPIKYVNNSLRFRKSATAYLSKTFATNPTRTKCHWHWNVKRGSLGSDQRMFSGYSGTSGDSTWLLFNSGDAFYFNVGGSNGQLYTNAVFRDPSAWYTFDLAFDSTQATASDRAKLWVNGVLQTWAAGTVTLNSNMEFALANANNRIGANWDSTLTFDGYMTEVQFIDGQALTPNSFGTFNSYGVWQPITYGGSYGTNGFYLPFNAGSSTYAGSFNGSAQYLVTSTNASLALGTNSFTIEYWLYIAASAGGTTAVSMGNSTTTYDSLFGYQSGSGIILYLSSTGSSWDIASGISMGSTPVGTWNHVAVTRSGNTFYTFLNGVQQATFSSSASIYQSANSVAIARAQSGSSVNGNISNVRVVVGTALYTSNFTIPTSNLTAVTNTKLLTLQNATIVDNSTNALTFTNTGSVVTGSTYPFSAAKVFNDQGPSGNNWTPNNISGATGTTLDYMTDVPTLTSATAANYCVLNPLEKYSGLTISDGNLKVTASDNTQYGAAGSLAISSGKWYYEALFSNASVNNQAMGFVTTNNNVQTSQWAGSTGMFMCGNFVSGTAIHVGVNGSYTQVSTTLPSAGSYLVCAIDYDNGKAWFGTTTSGGGSVTWYPATTGGTVGNPASGTNPTITFSTTYAVRPFMGSYGSGAYWIANFGQQPFITTQPSGFLGWNTYNL